MRNFWGTRTVFRIGLLAGALACIAGCSKDHQATEKRLRQLQEELTRVQNSSDRLEERLTALELSRPMQPTASAPAADDAPATLERPPLKVVRLAPEHAKPAEGEPSPAPSKEPLASTPAAGEPAAIEDDGTRTVIRGQGSRIETRVSRRKSAGSGSKRAAAVAPIQNGGTRQADSRSANAKPE